MDIGRILQMIINAVLRRAINGAVNKGVSLFARRGRQASHDATDDLPPPQDDAMAAKRARQLENQAKRLR